MLGNIGPLEILVVLVIALIVFGPKRVPELGRSLGKGIREFKASVSGENDDEDEEDGAGRHALESGRTETAAREEPVAHDRR